MGKAMGVVMGIVAVAISFIVFPILLSSAHDIQVDSAVESEADVATTSGTSATITLSSPLYKTRAADISGVSSSNVADTPTVSTVVSGTQVAIGGLATSATRTLNVTYDTDALTDYTGLGAIVGVSPMLIFISILGIIVAGAWFAWSRKG